MKERLSPEEAQAWVRVFRDISIVVVGAFILVYEVVVSSQPNAYLVGAGLAAFGLPPAFRLDVKARLRKGHTDDL